MSAIDSRREVFFIDAEHPALVGHFPGHPVVPGVVLLDRILDAAQRQFGLRAEALRLPQVKFLLPLLPLQAAQIVLDKILPEATASDAGDTRIRFRIERDDVLLASGELIAASTAIATDPA